MTEVDWIGKVNNAMFLWNKMLEDENNKKEQVIKKCQGALNIEDVWSAIDSVMDAEPQSEPDTPAEEPQVESDQNEGEPEAEQETEKMRDWDRIKM